EEKVIERADDDDVQNDEQGDPAKGDDRDVEGVERALELRGQIGAAISVRIDEGGRRLELLEQAGEKELAAAPLGEWLFVEIESDEADAPQAVGHAGDESATVARRLGEHVPGLVLAEVAQLLAADAERPVLHARPALHARELLNGLIGQFARS